jgi:inhibitor of cysteine peptidase
MQPLRWIRRAGLICPLLLVALAAAVGHSQAVSAATRVITGADQGGEVHLKAGETLELRLEANPSTGFMWYIQPQSTPLLRVAGQSESEAAGPSEGSPVGRPVVQIFRFEPRRSGDGVLLLHYVRSWEKPAPDEEQYRIHVFIE